MQVQYVYHCCLFPTKLAFILTCGASANIAENVFRVSSGTIGELRTVWEHCAHGIEMKFTFLITSEEPALTRDIYDSGTLWTICIWTTSGQNVFYVPLPVQGDWDLLMLDPGTHFLNTI